VRLALCQLNATVGDIAGNAQRIRAGIQAAREARAELVLFGELALTGYPPEDLLLREHFLHDARAELQRLAGEVHGIVAVVGFPEWAQTEDALARDAPAKAVYNAAAVLADGAVRSIYRKVRLPNYGVFDEQRYFKAGAAGVVIDVGGRPVGLTVCEDLWVAGPPASEEAEAGATLIVNISASPYHAGKGAERERLFAQRAREHNAHVAFCGLVGGQDELVFDGHSFVLDRTGETIARAAQFEEELLVCDLDPGASDLEPPSPGQPRRAGHPIAAPIAPVEAEVYGALCLGLRDYVRKNGFRHVVLGLSGGIDSALVGCIAADALGAERVSAAIMSSRYSSAATQDDARALAGALGLRIHELPIEAVMDAYDATLQSEFSEHSQDITEENLQARARGNLLMALSNKFGWLVLTTGNKSEMSVGYTTLYGDLAGGLAVIKDVPKTLVYRLCEWRNSLAGAGRSEDDDESARVGSSEVGGQRVGGDPIPTSILERAPSAELRPDQRDEDSLPPYELLDRILYGYIELDRGREQLIADGLPAAEVDRTIGLVDLAEYKRRQAPPGIKVTTRAFGRDRRMPITNRYVHAR
jgi:NAD+ synthase (glutamine-hydrolysing)